MKEEQPSNSMFKNATKEEIKILAQLDNLMIFAETLRGQEQLVLDVKQHKREVLEKIERRASDEIHIEST